MVYCGKASQGCQSCRTRRIKCDKVKPECSQCVRVSKKCPGYRDQLSLMFRDESSKVMQKAHAQWGIPESGSSEGGSSSHRLTSTTSTTSSRSHPSPASSGASPPPPPPPPRLDIGRKAVDSLPASSPASRELLSAVTNSVSPSSAASPLCPPVVPTLDEQGLQFYINRYVLGHPEEPKGPHEMNTAEWIWHPSLQPIMAAVGLASLSNLTGNQDMMTVARQRYGNALRQTGQLIQASNAPPLVTMRGVVMLALFEVVKGSHHSTGTPYAHVMGGAALLRSWLPMPSAPAGGFRALLQLCYAMFIPIHISGKTLPPIFIDWIAFTSERQPAPDRPSGDLAKLIARFVQISAFVRRHVLSDNSLKTGSILGQLIKLETEFEAWETNVDGEWRFKKVKDASLPREAVFDGEYHLYYDMWTARIWNHYRWGRVLTNQLMLEFVNQYPTSSLPLLSAAQQSRCFDTIRRTARETLVSVPSHWRHPLLPAESQIPVEIVGSAGSGAAGIPPLLFQMKVAVCAPGVPLEYWEWAVDIMQCIWGDMGMMHARSMIETLRTHREALEKSEPDAILAQGQGDGSGFYG